jgi:hypothetical protein
VRVEGQVGVALQAAQEGGGGDVDVVLQAFGVDEVADLGGEREKEGGRGF